MSKSLISYFQAEDILHLAINEEAGTSSVEITPNVTDEPNEKE